MMTAIFGGMVFDTIDQGLIQYNKRAKVWRAKFDQVIMKGRSLRADSEFTKMLDYYENMIN